MSEALPKRLTVGVVSRNGLPPLLECLQALPSLVSCADRVDFVLVDSASSDGTRAAMLAFASGRTDARVYAMEGRVNLAATRNVVLQHALPGAVLLVDSDVVINPAFVKAGLCEIGRQTCDVVFGQLPEILYDGDWQVIGQNHDRYHVNRRTYVKFFYGVVLLGPAVTSAKIVYDEDLRRAEDLEFSTRLSRNFRIMTLPMPMGTHHSIDYYAPARIQAFYRDSFMQPMGHLLRKHLSRARTLWDLRDAYCGYLFGLLLQISLLLSLAFAGVLAATGVAALIGLDVARFWMQGRLASYVAHRIVAPWQIVQGFLFPAPDRLSYRIVSCLP